MMNLPQFPHDLLDRILRLLDVESLLALRQTSKWMRVVCSEEPIWMQVAVQTASAVSEFEWKGSWQRTAQDSLCKGLKAGSLVKEVNKGRNCSGIVLNKTVFSDFLYRRWYRSHLTLVEFVPSSEISSLSRLTGKHLVRSDFVQKFDQGRKPVVLTDLQQFNALLEWDLNKLKDCFGEASFRVYAGFDKTLNMSLEKFLNYANGQNDEDPLYLFDNAFASKIPTFFGDCTIPSIFPDDLLDCLEESHDRPNFRWMLIGPMRSGTSWHLDPWCSSAWNLLISGRKRWVLYAPGKIPPGVRMIIDPHPKAREPYYKTCTALQWFLDVLPNLEAQDKPCFDFVQNPGETVFIPYGWWHCVLNLDITLSVTQNYVSETNLEACVQLLSHGAKGYYPDLYPIQGSIKEDSTVPRLSCRWVGNWLRGLWKHRPDLEETLKNLGSTYLYSEPLKKALMETCKLQDLPAPSEEDFLPFSATSNILLKTGEVLVKLYLHQSPLDACIQQSAEFEALEWIQELPEEEKTGLPRLLAKGLTNFEQNGFVLKVPYLMSSLCEGIPISKQLCKMDTQQQEQMAADLGQLVASFHSLHRRTSSQPKHPSKEAIEFKQVKDLLHWIQQNVTTGHEAFFQAQNPNLNWSANLGRVISLASDSFIRDHPCSSYKVLLSTYSHTTTGPWSPFLAFLEWRRSVCVGELKSGDLPSKLMDELEDYLPENVEDLLPSITGVGDVEELSPAFLHGDLTADNILFSPQNNNSVSIVDFGDFSYGDPLYDFISLHLSTFSSDSHLLESFLRSYQNKCIQKKNWTEFWINRKLSLSYSAMCYCILHEDNILEWLFTSHPDLQKSETWHEIQTSVWGILDQTINTT